jgi:ankyrin repeat protein
MASAAGFTPLHYAVLLDRASVIDRLLKAGADPSRRDSSGETPAR